MKVIRLWVRADRVKCIPAGEVRPGPVYDVEARSVAEAKLTLALSGREIDPEKDPEGWAKTMLARKRVKVV